MIFFIYIYIYIYICQFNVVSFEFCSNLKYIYILFILDCRSNEIYIYFKIKQDSMITINNWSETSIYHIYWYCYYYSYMFHVNAKNSLFFISILFHDRDLSFMLLWVGKSKISAGKKAETCRITCPRQRSWERETLHSCDRVKKAFTHGDKKYFSSWILFSFSQ